MDDIKSRQPGESRRRTDAAHFWRALLLPPPPALSLSARSPPDTMPLAAVAQLTSSSSISANLATAQALLRRAAQAGARAVFLPEACDFIAPAADVPALTASSEARSFVPSLAQTAKELGVWVSVGVHEKHETEEKRCWNTNFLVDAQGAVRERYRKVRRPAVGRACSSEWVVGNADGGRTSCTYSTWTSPAGSRFSSRARRCQARRSSRQSHRPSDRSA